MGAGQDATRTRNDGATLRIYGGRNTYCFVSTGLRSRLLPYRKLILFAAKAQPTADRSSSPAIGSGWLAGWLGAACLPEPIDCRRAAPQGHRQTGTMTIDQAGKKGSSSFHAGARPGALKRTEEINAQPPAPRSVSPPWPDGGVAEAEWLPGARAGAGIPGGHGGVGGDGCSACELRIRSGPGAGSGVVVVSARWSLGLRGHVGLACCAMRCRAVVSVLCVRSCCKVCMCSMSAHDGERSWPAVGLLLI